MVDIEQIRKLKSQLSSIQIALKKTRLRESELYAKRENVWRDAEERGLANRSSLAKYSGVDAMIVSRALNKPDDELS